GWGWKGICQRILSKVALLLLTIFPCLALIADFAAAQSQSIVSSKHNLSASGPGPVKTTSTTEICVFCHTPHGANPQGGPLWNRSFSQATYTPYTSTSLEFTPVQPNGYSKLCLSCHDGTIALDALRNKPGREGFSLTPSSAGFDFGGTTGPGNTMPPGPYGATSGSTRLLGTNLTNDHPISFQFTQAISLSDGELVDPTTLGGPNTQIGSVKLDEAGRVQCTSCHEPHDNQNTKFLRANKFHVSSSQPQICLRCHNKDRAGQSGWSASTHATSTRVISSTLLNAPTFPTPISGENQVWQFHCLSCHDPHTKQGAQRLHREGADSNQDVAIEETCFQCHKSYGVDTFAPDIRIQFAKDPDFGEGGTGSGMNIKLNPGFHEPVVTMNPVEPVLNNTKHVECVDCHNPHQVRSGNKLEGIRGIAIDGSTVVEDNAATDILEYQLCFRCHGPTFATMIPQSLDANGNNVRPPGGGNKQVELQTTNSAYHPVAGQGKNQSSVLNNYSAGGQLLSDLSRTSTIRCTDCHNNNYYSGPSFRGSVSQYASTLAEPKGPHGSTNKRILRGNYVTGSGFDNNSLPMPKPSPYNSNNFALCFNCHDETRLTDRRNAANGGQAVTNFYQDQFGAGRDSLHNLHLKNTDGINNFGSVICHECHYNVHGNAQATNILYVNGTTEYTNAADFPFPTHLINFAPDVTRRTDTNPNTGQTHSKPVWGKTTGGRYYCFLLCHGTNKMDGSGSIYDATDPQP
ncbi:MAG: hypothetical protein HY731_14275, partial [Candidatus Tectomicrobia bacterium]|nr:hypothetical protein [Candidatus Tectomicrobia bacterium]